MRKLVLGIALTVGLMAWSLSPAAVQGQDLLHYWNFNDPVENGNPWPAPVEANTGDGEITYSFDADNLDDFGGTDDNAQGGDEDGASFSVVGQSQNGEHFDLNVSTVDFEDIEIAYATRGTGTGFDTHTIEYSADGGGSFTEVETFTDRNDTSWDVLTFDLPSDADENPDLVVRFTVDGATSGSGNNRFDNITVEGESVSTSPPTAGTQYEIAVSESDLGNTTGQCLTHISGDLLVFFDSDEGAIYAWDGNDVIEHTSSSDLANNIPDISGDINRCNGVTSDDEFVYFILRNDGQDVQHIYRTEVADASNFATTEFDGANGLGLYQSTLYIAGYDFFGAPDDGVYEVDEDLSGTVDEVATDGNLSIEAIDAADGTVYGFSNDFGGGDFELAFFSLDLSDPGAGFSQLAPAYGGSSPLTDNGDQVQDVEYINFEGTPYLVAYNGSFSASEGEEWATVRISDGEIEMLFTRDDLTANTSADEYTGAFIEPMTVSPDGEVFASSREAFGATRYIAKVSGAAPLPVELATFTAQLSGDRAELQWETVSETSNAGFDVQHQAPQSSSFSSLGFVEGEGTTDESQSYRFTTDALAAGTHTFRLRQVDLDGTEEIHEPVTVEVQQGEALRLAGPHPVSAGATTDITVQLDRTDDVTVALYNVLGQRVETLHQGQLVDGEVARLSLDTSRLASGTYFLRLQGSSVTQTERVTVVR